ncbi:MAG: hypothetical protein WAU54_12845 [Chania sp.]
MREVSNKSHKAQKIVILLVEIMDAQPRLLWLKSVTPRSLIIA